MNNIRYIINNILTFLKKNEPKLGLNICVNIVYNLLFTYNLDLCLINFESNYNFDYNKIKIQYYKNFLDIITKNGKNKLNLERKIEIFVKKLVTFFKKEFNLEKDAIENLILKQLKILNIKSKNYNNKKGGNIFEKPSYVNGTGTSGNLGTLANDMSCSVQALFQTLESGFKTIVDLVEFPMDMGTAFEAKNAPNPNSIKID